jgi:hypothetical protein
MISPTSGSVTLIPWRSAMVSSTPAKSAGLVSTGGLLTATTVMSTRSSTTRACSVLDV